MARLLYLRAIAIFFAPSIEAKSFCMDGSVLQDQSMLTSNDVVAALMAWRCSRLICRAPGWGAGEACADLVGAKTGPAWRFTHLFSKWLFCSNCSMPSNHSSLFNENKIIKEASADANRVCEMQTVPTSEGYMLLDVHSLPRRI